MATAGMGDVLSGVIAGFCAQGLSLADAAKLAVAVHSEAGQAMCAVIGQRGGLASDLSEILVELINE